MRNKSAHAERGGARQGWYVTLHSRLLTLLLPDSILLLCVQELTGPRSLHRGKTHWGQQQNSSPSEYGQGNKGTRWSHIPRYMASEGRSQVEKI